MERVVTWGCFASQLNWAAADGMRQDWWSMQRRTDVGPVCLLTVQVALMSEVARARAVVDGHAGVAGVVEAWLSFLLNLAVEKANKVRCRVWDGW